MSYQLIICEKSSVAKELANVLGAYSKKQGFFEGTGYLISYAVGHLLQLAEAQAYDPRYENWCVEDLPIIPGQFKLTLSKSTKDQYSVLKDLLQCEDVTTIINACDAGREGELIFRHIYNYAGCKKPCKRLWISSLTEESILKGMASLKDSKEYDNLYVSAFARAKADWIFGINFTRLFSVINKLKLTVGRVQTPTLHLIVRRDLDIDNFVKELTYTIKMSNGALWFNNKTDAFKDKKAAETIKVKCLGKTANVVEVKTENKTENRPLLYSLTTLQQDANKILGFSAQKTLDVLQTLYEAKLTTYPRTDSNYLSNDMKSDVESIISVLGRFFKPDMVKAVVRGGLNLDSRIFNDSKVSDHHAVIPTKDISKMQTASLIGDQKALLELVIDRFIIILSDPHVYELTFYVFAVEGETFKASSKTVLQEGFKKFVNQDALSKKSSGEEICTTSLKYSEGEKFKVDKLDIVERVSKPKEQYTDATLLSIMNNIDREIEDEDMKQFVKEKGLGTPATRAGIIEKLISVAYVERKGKYLVSTSLGRKFIAAVPPTVKDVSVTADWEQLLLDIEKGSASERNFLKDVIDNVNVVVTLEGLKEGERIAPDKEVIGVCPRCSKQVFEGDKAFYCEGLSGEPKCSFSIFKKDKFFAEKGVSVSKGVAKKLLSEGKAYLKGLKKHSGQGTFDAYIVLNDTGSYVNFKLDFEKDDKDSVGACPRCGKQIFEKDRSFYCLGYRDDPKCTFSIWKNDKFFVEKSIPVKKTLVSKLISGKPVLIKGLKGKDGKDLSDSYIKMDDTGIYVNFKFVSCSKS